LYNKVSGKFKGIFLIFALDKFSKGQYNPYKPTRKVGNKYEAMSGLNRRPGPLRTKGSHHFSS
ncbi:MAG: hypothetical protein SO137_08770, partial [Gemmiger sp.]|uniref:hypothetical protein n=1 Tax=Gemmiger sp. TaxID=2049027 RepID=UPI002A80470B